MYHERELPDLKRIQIYYNSDVYNPEYTSPDPIFVADALIRKALAVGLKVLDLGCGSGVLGLSLKAMHYSIDLTLCDIDEKALKVAKRNSKALNLPAKFIQSDMFSNIDEKYDLIITSLPSFKKDQPTSQPSHTVYDPTLKLYKELFKHAPSDIIVLELQKSRQNRIPTITKGWMEILKTDYAYAFLRKADTPNKGKSPTGTKKHEAPLRSKKRQT